MSTVESEGRSWRAKGSLYPFPLHPEAQNKKSNKVNQIEASTSESEDMHFVLPPKPSFLSNTQNKHDVEEIEEEVLYEQPDESESIQTKGITRRGFLGLGLGFLGLGITSTKVFEIAENLTTKPPAKLHTDALPALIAQEPKSSIIENASDTKETMPADEIITADTYIIGDEKDPVTGEMFSYAKVAPGYANDRYIWENSEDWHNGRHSISLENGKPSTSIDAIESVFFDKHWPNNPMVEYGLTKEVAKMVYVLSWRYGFEPALIMTHWQMETRFFTDPNSGAASKWGIGEITYHDKLPWQEAADRKYHFTKQYYPGGRFRSYLPRPVDQLSHDEKLLAIRSAMEDVLSHHRNLYMEQWGKDGTIPAEKVGTIEGHIMKWAPPNEAFLPGQVPDDNRTEDYINQFIFYKNRLKDTQLSASKAPSTENLNDRLPPEQVPTNIPWGNPFGEIDTKLSTYFQEEYEFGTHTGYDLGILGDANITLNRPIYATSDGVIEYIDSGSKGYGYHAILTTQVNGKEVKVYYGHLNPNNRTALKNGETIKRDQVIGNAGSSGLSTGPHLHYEIREKQTDGSYLIVAPYLYGPFSQQNIWISEDMKNTFEQKYVLGDSKPVQYSSGQKTYYRVLGRR